MRWSWNTVRDVLLVGAAGALVVLVGWGVREYIWPSHASWREECVQSFTQKTVVMATHCSSTASGQPSSCYSSPETQYTTICTRSVWKCREGRDGSRVCTGPVPQHKRLQNVPDGQERGW